MGYQKNIIPEAVRRLDFSGISGTFADLGAELSDPLRILQFKNTTDVTAEITIDGTNVNFEIPTNSFDLYDLSANNAPDEMALLRAGIQLQVRRPAAELDPTEGAVIVQTWIGEV
ncbi:hypothetical protein LCGC14_1035560 [marine sediment metagenome]|uniref:Uncharacterized protein n=1 Tax=marine sediment metagenome TaxID=412755 RepID=A0A0F9QBI7_9ZZZZ